MSLLMDALRKAEESKKQAEQEDKETRGASNPEQAAAPDQEQSAAAPVPDSPGASRSIPDTPIEFEESADTAAADDASVGSMPQDTAITAGDKDTQPAQADAEESSGKISLSLEPMDESAQAGARQPLDVSAAPDYSAEPQLQSVSPAASEISSQDEKPETREKLESPLQAGSKQQELEEAMLRASSKVAGGRSKASLNDNSAEISPSSVAEGSETAVGPAAAAPLAAASEEISSKDPGQVPAVPKKQDKKQELKTELKAPVPSDSTQASVPAPAKGKSKAAKPAVELEKPGQSISARSEPDRRAARSVFAAKRKGKRFRIRRSTKIWALQIVAVLALVAGGYVIFFATAPSNDFNVPAEFLANSGSFSDEFNSDNTSLEASEDSIEFDAGLEPVEAQAAVGIGTAVTTAVIGEPITTAPAEIESAQQSSPGQTTTVAVLDEAITAPQQSTQVDSGTLETVVSQGVEAGVTDAAAQEAAEAVVENSVATAADQEEPVSVASGTAIEEAGSDAAVAMTAPEPASASISFVRKQTVSTVDPVLRQAYEAYQRGELAAARGLYQQVLLESPQQRDAMLGLAAIAGTDQDAMLAMELYSRLLARDPSDSVARAGLLGLRPTGSIAEQEREYRRLLEQQGDVASVVYAVGNFYAAQGRWNDAQRYYFSALQQAKSDALTGIPVNPDYAFNLAVSLERINQPGAAGTYYQEAISFASEHAASFDLSIARSRLASLAEVGSE